MTVLPDLLLAISGLLNFRNSCLSLEKWKPQTKSLVRQATRKQPLTVVKCHRVCASHAPDSRSASLYEGEDDDFVVICTNRAVLDVGPLSLHDLRADSLIRPIASRSVI